MKIKKILDRLISFLENSSNKTAETKPQLETTPSAPATETPKEKVIPDGTKDYNLFPSYANGQFLCYEYEQQICFIKDETIDERFGHVIGNGGKQLLFQLEPENQYDCMAVALYLDDKKLGYVYSGQTQQMIHDFHRKGWEMCSYINKYSVAEKTATYKIGFYKPAECFESKQFSLAKTNKKVDEYTTRAENLSYCDEGDVLLIEKVFLEDGYIVSNSAYEEIGELPKSAVNFIEENNPQKIYGILDTVEEDDNGKLKAKITVYLI